MTRPTGNPPGRPPGLYTYSEELEARVLELIADGKSLREISDLPDMPHRTTVYRWIEEVPGFADRYAHARVMQQHSLADDTLWISQTVVDPHRARVMMDANRWHAAKLLPKVYGERLDVNQSGMMVVAQPTAQELAEAAQKLLSEL